MFKKLMIMSAFFINGFAVANDAPLLQTKLASLKDFHAQFNQKVVDDAGEVVLLGEGQLKLKRPNNIKWEQTSPDENLLVSNGDKTYYFDTFAEQVTILNSNKLIKSTPFVLLTSNDQSLWDNYTVSKQSDGFIITPKDLESAHVEQLKVIYDNEQLIAMNITDLSGQQSHYRFSDIKQNQGIDNKQFEFVMPKGVMIDDQSASE